MTTNDVELSESWHLRAANGRLPVVREIKRQHGEASVFEATIGTGDTLTGPIVVKLDFGYGYGGRERMEAVARLIAEAPEWRVRAIHAESALRRANELLEAPQEKE